MSTSAETDVQEPDDTGVQPHDGLPSGHVEGMEPHDGLPSGHAEENGTPSGQAEQN